MQQFTAAKHAIFMPKWELLLYNQWNIWNTLALVRKEIYEIIFISIWKLITTRGTLFGCLVLWLVYGTFKKENLFQVVVRVIVPTHHKILTLLVKQRDKLSIDYFWIKLDLICWNCWVYHDRSSTTTVESIIIIHTLAKSHLICVLFF